MTGVWRPVAAATAAAALLFALAVSLKAPRHDRAWVAHLAATPTVTIDENAQANSQIVTISPVRDWQYLPLEEGVAILEVFRTTARYDLANLRQVWFVEEPHPGLPMMAHTFVIFDFGPLDEGGNGLIGLTIEARKTDDERYDPVLGALNKFELIYVWAEPRDLMTRRATLLDRALYLYPLSLTPAQRDAYFMALAERTGAIAARPRFYNTLRSNCTNELAKAAGLPWDPAFILTGGAAEALFERGVIAGDTFAEVKDRADIADAIAGRAWRTEDFNTLIRRRGRS